MFKSLHITLIIILSLLYNNNIFAAKKFYKWVDENGQTHFSQKAPPVNSANNDNVIQITGKAGSFKMLPYKKGSLLYCGSLELVGAQYSDSVLLDDLKLNLPSWAEIRQEAEKNYNQLLDKKASHTKIKKAQTWLNETSCRVSWASEQIIYFTSTKYKKDVLRSNNKKTYEALLKERNLECPDSINYMGRGVTWSSTNPDVMVGDEAEAYYQCQTYYEKELKKYKNKKK
jgi:hypothetical protein